MDIALIGSGNLGRHLGIHLKQSGHRLLQVFSRALDKANDLAQRTGSQAVNQLSTLTPEASIYILAVSDDAIAEVGAQLSRRLPPDALVVHTSGATPSQVLAPHFKRYGVFYPLQTFSRNREIDMREVPFCLTASSEEDVTILEKLAQDLSRSVYRITDEQRAYLHLGGVWVNNFTNHLFHIGEALLKEQQLPFDLLRPLIRETAAKIQQQPPAAMQTGPAVRGDRATMERHRALLDERPDWKALYRLISESIARNAEPGQD